MHRSSARRTRLFAAALALGALLGCATTGSGERSTPKRADSKSTAAEEAEEAQQRARIHYDLGIARWREGRNPEAIGELAARYGLEMDVASVPGLCAEHGLVFGA